MWKLACLLLDHTQDFEVADENGRTVAHYMAMVADYASMEALMERLLGRTGREKGVALLNYSDAYGMTPYLCALAMMPCPELIHDFNDWFSMHDAFDVNRTHAPTLSGFDVTIRSPLHVLLSERSLKPCLTTCLEAISYLREGCLTQVDPLLNTIPAHRIVSLIIDDKTMGQELTVEEVQLLSKVFRDCSLATVDPATGKTLMHAVANIGCMYEFSELVHGLAASCPERVQALGKRDCQGRVPCHHAMLMLTKEGHEIQDYDKIDVFLKTLDYLRNLAKESPHVLLLRDIYGCHPTQLLLKRLNQAHFFGPNGHSDEVCAAVISFIMDLIVIAFEEQANEAAQSQPSPPSESPSLMCSTFDQFLLSRSIDHDTPFLFLVVMAACQCHVDVMYPKQFREPIEVGPLMGFLKWIPGFSSICVNLTDDIGQNLLHVAARNYCSRVKPIELEFFNYLCDCGVDFDARDHIGMTPLLGLLVGTPSNNEFASGYIRLELLQLLLEKGANHCAVTESRHSFVHLMATLEDAFSIIDHDHNVQAFIRDVPEPIADKILEASLIPWPSGRRVPWLEPEYCTKRRCDMPWLVQALITGLTNRKAQAAETAKPAQA
eukprot:c8423_g2_i1.p1 GENE.c8423_g2_i1~~c8423_g2_i1.p1  ORF type:complete len:638 (-),score=139.93 c8423_g2_i1:105-1919(-)